MVFIDAGFKEELKKAWRKTQKAIKHAIAKPVQRLGLLIRNKKTRKIVETVEHVPFQITKPFIRLSNNSFDTNPKAEMKKVFQQSNLDDEIVETCIDSEKKKKCEYSIYSIRPGTTRFLYMIVSLTGMEVLKNENNFFSRKGVRLLAKAKVFAGEAIHWRKVVREYWIHKHETKEEEYRGRRLTEVEVQTLMDTLFKALKDDSRFQAIPNVIRADEEIEVQLLNNTVRLNL